MLMDVNFEIEELTPIKSDGEFTVSIVPVDKLDIMYPYLEAWLDSHPHLWNTVHTKDTIRQFLQAGKLQLWLVSRDSLIYIAFMTTAAPLPTHNALFITWAVGAQVKKYIRLALAGVEQIAAKQDIAAVYIEGRVGWTELLKACGYKYLHTVFAKNVVKERAN